MRRIISKVIKENKGSLKDPSFAFKASVVILFLFITLGNSCSDKIKTEVEITKASADILSEAMSVVVEEPPDLLIAQDNTVYASTPIIPTIQVLGSFVSEEKKEIISYTVREGDSISSIASKFEISQETVKWANNVSGSLKTGQDLIILPVSGVFHIVSSGETVGGIANKYKAKSQEIIDFNDITDNEIRPGDILIIPGGEKPVAVASAPKAGSSSSWLIPPISGYISQGLHWHNAVDIANSCGTPVYASAAGKVQLVGYDPIGGNFVRILHSNGIVTYYGHLSRIRVSIGQSVSQGFHIGDVGNTGYTIGRTGCHVHFEVRGGTNPFASYRVGYRF